MRREILVGLCLVACGGVPEISAPAMPKVCDAPPHAEPAPKIMGFCPSEPIRTRVKAQSARFAACYETARQSRPELRGKVVLAWRIEPSGQVRGIGVRRSNIDENCMLRCLVNVVESMEFSKGAGRCYVAYPLAFDG